MQPVENNATRRLGKPGSTTSTHVRRIALILIIPIKNDRSSHDPDFFLCIIRISAHSSISGTGHAEGMIPTTRPRLSARKQGRYLHTIDPDIRLLIGRDGNLDQSDAWYLGHMHVSVMHAACSSCPMIGHCGLDFPNQILGVYLGNHTLWLT